MRGTRGRGWHPWQGLEGRSCSHRESSLPRLCPCVFHNRIRHEPCVSFLNNKVFFFFDVEAVAVQIRLVVEQRVEGGG